MTTSTELSQKASTWLSQTLATEQRPVTFRELARELNCHIHTAKNLLNDYLSTYDAVPTFLVSGPLLAHSTLGHTQTMLSQEAPPTQSLAHLSATQKVRIVNMDEQSDDGNSEAGDPEEEVEELGARTEAMEEDTESQQRPQKEGDVARWGVVLVGADELDDKRKLFEVAAVQVYAIAPAPIKDPAILLSSAFGLREKSDYLVSSLGTIVGEALLATQSKPVVQSSDKKPAPKKEDKPAKQEPTNKLVKKEVVKPAVMKERTPPKPQKLSASRSKRRVIASDSEEEDIEVAPAQRKAPLQQTSSMEEDVSQPMPKSAVKAKPASSEEGAKKRKRRRVKKSKMEKDAKGYMVTKDYWTDESYSGSETDTESPTETARVSSKLGSSRSQEPSRTSSSASAAGPSRPSSKGIAKKAQMGQSTLAGFFKKK
ncbi:uncharacterized protein CcaverHIS019_0302640 [Cutaneotrichosporon cavernicola]|uniref:DNA polymerase delta subunit 3 n=1 Tax=Cutaneotrichosporon cavernicola TaxID=279322 RepID=A0AA48I5U2_9TREE|nr:uncharacterized protein CcaverHIS019_0302640 [Cutaneotrichosporon cavernicola]BEI90194.1 hypothetical protein CcaverHIS019_0302640 [Cutaneotrichosporon cavernicola]BEI97973.1 hypothetical protein CcaverHIS631_0302720 [Cutaneotrichosporon cavernicola]